MRRHLGCAFGAKTYKESLGVVVLLGKPIIDIKDTKMIVDFEKSMGKTNVCQNPNQPG